MGVEKCQGCAYLNPIMFHCGKYLRGIETAIFLCPTAKPHTNADRIRAMTDEELAEWFERDPMRDICPNNCYETPTKHCAECALDWLKQEVT